MKTVWMYEFRFDLPVKYSNSYNELYGWCKLHTIDEFVILKVFNKITVSFKSYTDYVMFDKYLNPVPEFEDVPY